MRVWRLSVNSSRLRNIFVYALIAIAILAIIFGVRNNGPTNQELKISELARDIKGGKAIASIMVVQNEIRVNYANGNPSVTHKDPSSTLEQQLQAYGVTPEDI